MPIEATYKHLDYLIRELQEYADILSLKNDRVQVYVSTDDSAAIKYLEK